MFRIATAILATVFLSACKRVAEPSLVLDTDIWVLCAAEDSCNPSLQRYFPRDVMPSLEFQRDGQVAGYASCNTFSGTYTTREKDSVARLRIELDGMTLNPCPNAPFEGMYIERLSRVRSYVIQDKRLMLRDSAGNTILTFIPASLTQKDRKQ